MQMPWDEQEEKRNNKRSLKTINSCYDEIINLQQWLSDNNWKNAIKLKIRNFFKTGRGVSSKKCITPNDILISISIDLMITYKNIKLDYPIKEKLTMQEMLAFFLIIEKSKENSIWVKYLQSLPEKPPALPWLANGEEINLFPADLRNITHKSVENLKKFKNKIYKSMSKASCVFEDNLFNWGYAMVNTRAVYINPDLICNDSSRKLLLDEPSMALCPFLDMFNHHFLANTEANLVQDNKQLVYYELKSLTGFKKNEQIFISYGRHDNVKLLMEYGFFIPGNIFDTINFEFEDVLEAMGINLDQHRYKYIKEHNFEKELYLGREGVSYNLKIVVFICYAEEFRHIDAIVFSDNYPHSFLKQTLPKQVRTLLNFKGEQFKSELNVIENGDIITDSAKNVVEFVKYRIQFVEELKLNIK